MAVADDGETLRCGRLNRPRSVRENDRWVHSGPYFAVAIEVSNGTLASAGVLDLDRAGGTIRETSL